MAFMLLPKAIKLSTIDKLSFLMGRGELRVESRREKHDFCAKWNYMK